MKKTVYIILALFALVNILSAGIAYGECNAPLNCGWDSYNVKNIRHGGGIKPIYTDPGSYTFYVGRIDNKVGAPPPKDCKVSGPYELKAGKRYIVYITDKFEVRLSETWSDSRFRHDWKGVAGLIYDLSSFSDGWIGICMHK